MLLKACHLLSLTMKSKACVVWIEQNVYTYSCNLPEMSPQKLLDNVMMIESPKTLRVQDFVFTGALASNAPEHIR